MPLYDQSERHGLKKYRCFSQWHGLFIDQLVAALREDFGANH